MKTMLKSIVAALAVVVGLNASAFDISDLMTTYYARETIACDPDGVGKVYVTDVSLFNLSALNVKEDDYKVGPVSDDGSALTFENNGTVSFGCFHKDDEQAEFLNWTDANGDDIKDISVGNYSGALRTITATSQDSGKPTAETIYAHFHKHEKGYVVSGMTIDYKCTNTTSKCKNSCGSSSATLVADAEMTYDGTTKYSASVEGDQTAEIKYYDQGGNEISAPSALGSYKVVMTYGDKTVYKDFSITHTHDWTYSAKDGVITMTCKDDKGCAKPKATLTADPATYTGAAYTGAKLAKDELFVGDPALTYYQGGTALAGAPTKAGGYTVKATIGDVVATVDFMIGKADLEGVTAELNETSLNYTGAEQENGLKSIALGKLGLTADDYEISGTTAKGSGYSNETYTVTLTGKGDNFTGTKTLTWEIVAPTGTFAEDAFKTPSKLVFNQQEQAWETKSTLAWPEPRWVGEGLTLQLLDLTTTEKAVVSCDVGETTVNKKSYSLGSLSASPLDIVGTVDWTFGCTAADLEKAAANDEDVVHTMTACGLAWWQKVIGESGYGDKDGVKATDFEVTIATQGLVLDLPDGARYDLGGTELKNVKIRLAASAEVTTTVRQDGSFVSADPSGSVGFEEKSGVYTYKVQPHAHTWTWTVSGNVLTVACDITGCAYQQDPLVLTIAPEVAEKYCDKESVTAKLTGGQALVDATEATVGAIEYWQGETELASAPSAIGDYTAKCRIISRDLATTNTIEAAFSILTGQAICDGIHVGDAAEYLEKNSQDDMEILVGKDFTASKTFVVPKNWKAETVQEVGLTIEELFEEFVAGKYRDIFTWDDFGGLLAGRVTAAELIERLKKAGKEIALLDCGMKTLDLNGFTVMAKAGEPLVRNEGTLVLKGAGAMTTNGCETLLVNAGMLSVESGRYVGLIKNEGSLLVSGGHFTGKIANGEGGTVVLTGGEYEIKPDEDFVAEGYDLVRRDGIYYVEKHEHKYTFLPLGNCLMTATCRNWFVDDPDQLIQFSNCGAHKLGIFIATRSSMTGVLPKRAFANSGTSVEAAVVGYNYSALAKIGSRKNIKELVEIAEEALSAEMDWDELDAIEKIQRVAALLETVNNLDINLKDLVWSQDKIEEETGLKFGDIKYINAETDEELAEAPSAAGKYRARVVITTPKGNAFTRSWGFSIGMEYEDDFDAWLDAAKDELRAGWKQFRKDMPTEEEIKDYFDELDQKHLEYFQNLTNKYADIDQEVIDAHKQLIDDLRQAHETVQLCTTTTVNELKKLYDKHEETYFEEAERAIEKGWQEFRNHFECVPSEEDVEEFFDNLDKGIKNFFEDLEEKGHEIDPEVKAAHDKMVEDLKKAHKELVEWAKDPHVDFEDMYEHLKKIHVVATNWTAKADEKIREAYENHKENADELVREWHEAIMNDFRRFCDEVKKETGDWPTCHDVETFFDELDEKVEDWCEEMKGKHEPVDQKIRDAHKKMVERLRQVDEEITTWAEQAHEDIREAYENHKENADELVREWHEAIANDFNRFYEEVVSKTKDWPTCDEIKDFFKTLDERVENWFEELKEKHGPVDQAIVDAHDEMVKMLRNLDDILDRAEQANERVKQHIADHVVVCFVNNQTNFYYNGREQGPKICSVTCGCIVLDTEDYEVTGETGAVDEGTYALTVKGRGIFKAYEKDFAWSILPKQKIDISGAKVFTEPMRKEFVYTGTPHELAIDAVVMNCTLLTEDLDYTNWVDSVTHATEVGDYAITIEGIGDYTGTRTVAWSIAAPSREFGEEAFEQVALGGKPYGEIMDDVLTVTDSTNLLYSTTTSNWYAGVRIDWPYNVEQIFRAPQYTTPEAGYVKVTAPTYTNEYTVAEIDADEAEDKYLSAELGAFYRFRHEQFETFVIGVDWNVEVTIADIEAAKAKGEKELVYTITVGSPAHTEDPEGLKETTYTIRLPFDGLVLKDENNKQVYPPKEEEPAMIAIVSGLADGETFTWGGFGYKKGVRAFESFTEAFESGSEYVLNATNVHAFGLQTIAQKPPFEREWTLDCVSTDDTPGNVKTNIVTIAADAKGVLQDLGDQLAEITGSGTILLSVTNGTAGADVYKSDLEGKIAAGETVEVIYATSPTKKDERGDTTIIVTDEDTPKEDEDEVIVSGDENQDHSILLIVDESATNDVTVAGNLEAKNKDVVIVNETENALTVGAVKAGNDVLITNVTETGAIVAINKVVAANDVVIDNNGHLEANVEAGGDIVIDNGAVHTLVGTYNAKGTIVLNGDSGALSNVTLDAGTALTLTGTNVITGPVSMSGASVTNEGHTVFSVAGNNKTARLEDFDLINKGVANELATFGIEIDEAQATGATEGTYNLAGNAASAHGKAFGLKGVSVATSLAVDDPTVTIGQKKFTLKLSGTDLTLTVEKVSTPTPPGPTPPGPTPPGPTPTPGSIDELREQLGDNADIDYDLDDSGNVTNVLIVMKDNFDGTLSLPENLVLVTIDLAGFYMRGPDGIETDVDGKSAIVVRDGTWLRLVGTGWVIGGNGFPGANPGKGAKAILPVESLLSKDDGVFVIDGRDGLAEREYMTFVTNTVEVVEGEDVVLHIWGGNAYKPASCQFSVSYETAKKSDLYLSGMKFPMTVSWAAGEVGFKTVTIPTKYTKKLEGVKTFTARISHPEKMYEGAVRVCRVAIRDEGEESGVPYVSGLSEPSDFAKIKGAGRCPEGKRVTLSYSMNSSFKYNGYSKPVDKNAKFLGWYKAGADGQCSDQLVTTCKQLVIDRTKKPQASTAKRHVIVGDVSCTAFYAKFETSNRVIIANPAIDGRVAGTVSGDGYYADGKTVTVKAKAKSGYVFAGWYDDSTIETIEPEMAGEEGDCFITKDASFKLSVDQPVTELRAVYVTKAEDAAHVRLSVDGNVLSATSAFETNLTAGVAVSWPVVPAGLSATTVSASGLPAGLKLTRDKVTKAYAITGAATSKKDALCNVKLTVTTAGKTKVVFQMKIDLGALDAWAYGTFNGGSDTNMVALTVSASGKISGTLNRDGQRWTLSATSYDAFDGETFYANVVATNGKLVETNAIVVAAESLQVGAKVSVRGIVESDQWSACQNLWKVEPWKTVAAGLRGQTQEYAVPGGTVAIKVGASGTVVAAGVFGATKASCSTVLLPRAVYDGDVLRGYCYDVVVYFYNNAGAIYSGVLVFDPDGVESAE